MSRMVKACELADAAGVRLVHENEHRIYGDSPDRVVDLLQTVGKDYFPQAFGAVYDAANYVFCGYDPWEGWQRTKDWTVHLHIKDWKAGAKHGSIPGEGDGRIPESIADAVKRGYDGFATLEPHLLGGGPTGGVTGPELFPKAVAAFKQILDRAGATYQ
jgi:sugar phosphate isomerase/epimerase